MRAKGPVSMKNYEPFSSVTSAVNEFLHHRGHRGHGESLEINDALLLQFFEEARNLRLNLRRIAGTKQRLQFFHDLLDGALAVTTLQNFSSRPLQTNRAFGEQQHSLDAIRFRPATPCGESRPICAFGYQFSFPQPG
jgi:hypothetical protein